jgi:hypothetical protein
MCGIDLKCKFRRHGLQNAHAAAQFLIHSLEVRAMQQSMAHWLAAAKRGAERQKMKRCPHLEMLRPTSEHVELVYEEQQAADLEIELIGYNALDQLLEVMVRSLER